MTAVQKVQHSKDRNRGRLQPLTTRKQVTNPAPHIRTARPPSPPREHPLGASGAAPASLATPRGSPPALRGPGAPGRGPTWAPRAPSPRGLRPSPSPPGTQDRANAGVTASRPHRSPTQPLVLPLDPAAQRGRGPGPRGGPEGCQLTYIIKQRLPDSFQTCLVMFEFQAEHSQGYILGSWESTSK